MAADIDSFAGIIKVSLICRTHKLILSSSVAKHQLTHYMQIGKLYPNSTRFDYGGEYNI